jgi:hypothetical protein
MLSLRFTSNALATAQDELLDPTAVVTQHLLESSLHHPLPEQFISHTCVNRSSLGFALVLVASLTNRANQALLRSALRVLRFYDRTRF